MMTVQIIVFTAVIFSINSPWEEWLLLFLCLLQMKIIRNRRTRNRRPPTTAPRTKYSCVLDDSPTAMLGLTTWGGKAGVSVTAPGKCNKTWQQKLPTMTIKWSSTGFPNPEEQTFGHFHMILTASFESQVHIWKHCLDRDTVHCSAIILPSDSMQIDIQQNQSGKDLKATMLLCHIYDTFLQTWLHATDITKVSKVSFNDAVNCWHYTVLVTDEWMQIKR